MKLLVIFRPYCVLRCFIFRLKAVPIQFCRVGLQLTEEWRMPISLSALLWNSIQFSWQKRKRKLSPFVSSLQYIFLESAAYFLNSWMLHVARCRFLWKRKLFLYTYFRNSGNLHVARSMMGWAKAVFSWLEKNDAKDDTPALKLQYSC